MKRIYFNSIMVSFAILLTGCASSKSQKVVTKNSNNSAKHIAFVYNKPQSTRIWYKLDFNTFNEDGKNTVPQAIIISNNGKITYYNTTEYYTNWTNKKYHFPTIGEYSKMDDSEIIHNAKNADKKSYEITKVHYKAPYTASSGIVVHKYIAPTTKKIKLSFTTDKTGNYITNEKITPSHPTLAQTTSRDGENSYDYSSANFKFTFTSFSSAFTIYQSEFWGYRFDDKDESGSTDNSRYYLTKKESNEKIGFDSLKTKGAIVH